MTTLLGWAQSVAWGGQLRLTKDGVLFTQPPRTHTHTHPLRVHTCRELHLGYTFCRNRVNESCFISNQMKRLSPPPTGRTPRCEAAAPGAPSCFLMQRTSFLKLGPHPALRRCCTPTSATLAPDSDFRTPPTRAQFLPAKVATGLIQPVPGSRGGLEVGEDTGLWPEFKSSRGHGTNTQVTDI